MQQARVTVQFSGFRQAPALTQVQSIDVIVRQAFDVPVLLAGIRRAVISGLALTSATHKQQGPTVRSLLVGFS
jgi:hypothetical protein